MMTTLSDSPSYAGLIQVNCAARFSSWPDSFIYHVIHSIGLLFNPHISSVDFFSTKKIHLAV